tara:strand:+ start:127 stop:3162 length:3036 start_codon:yes stop_codon:yes gene_type:complete
MRLLSLKSVYKDIINEAILDQSTFLFRLVDVINKRSDLTVKDQSILGNLLSSIKSTDLENLQGSKNKKARKKAEILIHKNLRSFKGIDGEPINLKKIRPLYDSIVKFVSTKKDVEIEHCILAADYFMKDFYDDANPDIKQSINDGNIEFQKILKVTKFYQQYFEFKSQLGLFDSDAVRVFEDNNIKVIYPQSPYAFQDAIANSGESVEWCTQSPTTWQRYNDKQYVMILQDKTGGEGIWSLKVDFSGEVDYYGTCDVYNDHMDRETVKYLLTDEAEEAIYNMVNDGSINRAYDSGAADDDIFQYLKGLLDTNNFQEIFNILIAINQYDSSGTKLIDSSREFLDYAISQNKLNNSISVIIDVIASLNFDVENFPVSLFKRDLPFDDKNFKDTFNEIIVQKCLNKRNHVKYFILFNKFYERSQYDLVQANIKQISLVALNKRNPINFKKVLHSIATSGFAVSILSKKNYFPEFFESKGFKIYFKDKKEKIISPDSPDYDFQPLGGLADSLVAKLIKSNKEAFAESIVSLNTETGSNITYESLDLDLIVRFIVHNSAFQKNDVYNMNLEKLLPHMLEIDEESLESIKSKMYTDVDFVKFMCIKNEALIESLLKHFYSKYDGWLSDANRNVSIDLGNQDSYTVFSYLFLNSKERVRKNVNERMPALTIAYFFNSTIKMLDGFGKSAESLDSEIKELLVLIASRDLFYEGLIHKNSRIDESLFDFYLNIISEVKFVNPVSNFAGATINDRITQLDLLKSDGNSPVEKFVQKLVTIPGIKNYISSRLQNQRFNSTDFYAILYSMKYNRYDQEVLSEICTKWINIISPVTSDPDLGPLLRNSPFEGITGKQINDTFINMINHTKRGSLGIGRLIDRIDFYAYPYFKDFVVKFVLECNQAGVGFHKESLSEIFYNPYFQRFPKATRQELLTNFISKGSDSEENVLDTRDRVIVKNCLRDGIKKGSKHLEKDYEFIMNLCEKLDDYSKFQLRTAFPSEERLKSKSTNEALLKSYIRLFFS